jgi:NTP pyrophosphatase (non-canonical NTP hydrolase)
VPVRQAALWDLNQARDLADEKWGERIVPFTGVARERILTFLVEEVGEVAAALQDGTDEDIMDELLDVGQVVVAWLEREYFQAQRESETYV